MNINRNNYEEFFINYLDGTLSDHEVVAFENFLLANPDLREELEGLENVVLEPGDQPFPQKGNLKHIDLSLPVTNENFDYFCVADMEGDLSPEQLDGLQKYLVKNPGKNAVREKYRLVRLTPDTTIHFPAIQNLRKRIFVAYRREIYTAVAIAAGIALLAGAYFGFIGTNVVPVTNVAVVSGNESTAIDTTSEQTPVPAEKTDEPEKEKNQSIKKNQALPTQQKSAPKGFSFKVVMPVASAIIPEEGRPKIDEKKVLSRISINPAGISNRASPLAAVNHDKIKPLDFSTVPMKRKKLPVAQANYATIEQFAKQKFSNLVFGKNNSEEVTLWNVVTAGIDKVNDLTGTDMKLERETDPEGQIRKLKFDSKLLKISTPVNKEE